MAMQHCTKNLLIQIGKATITAPLFVVEWTAYDVILSKFWLFEVSPKTDWRSSTMKVCIRDRFLALEAKCSSSEGSTQVCSREDREATYVQRLPSLQ